MFFFFSLLARSFIVSQQVCKKCKQCATIPIFFFSTDYSKHCVPRKEINYSQVLRIYYIYIYKFVFTINSRFSLYIFLVHFGY